MGGAKLRWKADIDTLYRYKNVADSMPFADKICGFVCGVDVIQNWPKYDLSQLYYDTHPIYGKFEDILCVIPSEIDALEATKVSAANIYHAACHNYLFDGDKQENLQSLYKSIFFIVRAKYFGENSVYISSTREIKRVINAEILLR